MTKLNQIASVVILLMLLSTSVDAQEESHTKIAVEIDPITFGFKGYGVHLRVQPKNSEHFNLGAGIYAMNMPDFLVDFHAENRDKGWEVRLNRGYGLFGEYHFSEVNQKWFVGTQTSIQSYRIKNEGVTGSEDFSNFLLMAYGGYTWQPFDVNFYIKPWAGIGYTKQINGNNVLENLTYDVSPVIMFMTLHLGYTF